MEPFATLTTTRGDRPQFLAFLNHQLDRMSLQPTHRILIEDPPTTEQVDLVPRFRRGVELAKRLGIDVVYVAEDDDYLPKDYFNLHWIGDKDFIGSTKSIYYNIRNKSYATHSHPNHSSLFCTAFRISALEGFRWPDDAEPFLDISLWRHALKGKNYTLTDEPRGVGIKHGIGKCAGNGHKAHYQDVDRDGKVLQSLVDKEAYAFYRSL